MDNRDHVDIDYLTFLNLQANPRLNCLVNAITHHELPALCCTFTGSFSTSKSQMSLMLTYILYFGTFKLPESHLPYEHYNFAGTACIMLYRYREDLYINISLGLMGSDIRDVYFHIMIFHSSFRRMTFLSKNR